MPRWGTATRGGEGNRSIVALFDVVGLDDKVGQVAIDVYSISAGSVIGARNEIAPDMIAPDDNIIKGVADFIVLIEDIDLDGIA